MQEDSVIIEGARIVFRNFAGKEGPYNREGDRNFSVLLDEEIAEKMLDDGWNVKYMRQTDPDLPRQAHLPVSVSYKYRPPTVVLTTAKNRTTLDEDDIAIVDMIDIDFTDLIVRPYPWAVNGKSGIKAYLQSCYVRIHEDYLKLKYESLEELPMRAGRTDEGDVLAIEAGPDWVDGEVVD